MDAIKIIKNSLYVSGVQLATMLFGMIKTFLIPKMLGVIGFGWWQYYLLWVGYVGLFALGFNDGFYLKYGGYDYNQLPKSKLSNSLWVFALVELIISLLFALVVCLFSEADKSLVLLAVSVNIPLHGIKGFFIYVFQVTNRIKRYSFYSLIDRFLFLIIVGLFYGIGVTNYWIIISLDITSQLFVIFMMMTTCRDLLMGYSISLKDGINEFKDNIKIGSKLMIALFSATFAAGLTKLFVEHYQGIEDFSCYAFATASTSVINLFISGLATIAYPTLARLDKNSYDKYFTLIDRFISIIAFGSFLIYPLLVIFINSYFHEYSRCLEYYPLVVCSIFLYAKVSLVINTFYKAMRQETTMLFVNISQCLLLIVLMFVFNAFKPGVKSVVIASVTSIFLIYTYSKIYLSNILNCWNKVDFLLEILGMGIFILAVHNGGIISATIYFLYFVALLFCRRNLLVTIYSKISYNHSKGKK